MPLAPGGRTSHLPVIHGTAGRPPQPRT